MKKSPQLSSLTKARAQPPHHTTVWYLRPPPSLSSWSKAPSCVVRPARLEPHAWFQWGVTWGRSYNCTPSHHGYSTGLTRDDSRYRHSMEISSRWYLIFRANSDPLVLRVEKNDETCIVNTLKTLLRICLKSVWLYHVIPCCWYVFSLWTLNLMGFCVSNPHLFPTELPQWPWPHGDIGPRFCKSKEWTKTSPGSKCTKRRERTCGVGCT